MIGSTNPTCTGIIGSTTIGVISCSFSGSTLQVTAVYLFTSVTDSTSNMKITISTFKNPISTATMSGFSVMT
jgi:hypothetical protein